VKFVHDTSGQGVVRTMHMLQHVHHGCACTTSLTFIFTAVVFEVLLLIFAECMGQREIRLAYALIEVIAIVDNDSK